MKKKVQDGNKSLGEIFVFVLITNSCAPNGAQAFLLPANGETERGVKTIDKARSLISNH